MKSLIFILFALMLNGSPLFPYSRPSRENAVAGGTGGAFTAYQDDPEVLYYNPAGCYSLERNSVSLNYNDYLNNLEPESGLTAEDGYFPVDACSYSLNLALAVKQAGCLGLSYTAFNYSGLNHVDILGLSFSFDLSRLIRLSRGAGMGLSVKYVRNGYSPTVYNEDFFREYNSGTSGFSLDAGFLFTIMDKLKLGIGLIDCIGTETGLKDEDVTPGCYRLGLLYTENIHPVGGSILRVLFDCDYEDRDYNLHAGAEWELPAAGVTLRTGVNFHYLALGAGYEYGHFISLNYAVNYYIGGFEGAVLDHRLNAGVKF
ncbi:MAG: hypothetical protein PHF84_04850 [bacterium]|nr:hypothetical protein [bacterium]